MALAAARDEGDIRMGEEFRATRRLMPPTQDVHHCQPIQHQRHLGNPLFGAPTALNAEIAAGAYQQNNGRNIPHMCRRIPTQQIAPIARSALGPTFRAKKCCWRCGWQKTLHLRAGMPFGDSCTGNLGCEHCSKCWNRATECHMGDRIGPHCNKEAGARSKQRDWCAATQGPKTGMT